MRRELPAIVLPIGGLDGRQILRGYLDNHACDFRSIGRCRNLFAGYVGTAILVLTLPLLPAGKGSSSPAEKKVCRGRLLCGVSRGEVVSRLGASVDRRRF